VFAIWACAFWGDGFLCSTKHLRSVSYAVLLGVFVSLVLAVVGGHEIVTSNEGFLGYRYGFTGGIKYKNYLAADMLSVFIGLYLYGREIERKRIDRFIMYLSGIILFLSGSRGGYALFALFLVGINVDKIRMIAKQHRKLFFAGILIAGIVVFAALYTKVALNSATYMYRIRGLLNYLNYYRGDTFHLLFGNTESIYDQELSYVYMVRFIVGWDGSLEFSWLNVIIKSGLVGVIGYALLYFRYVVVMFSTNEWRMKSVIFALVITMLASSLVEAYIQSVHAVFGIYGYLVLSGRVGVIRNDGHDQNAERLKRMAGL
jgi:hypothetical protein